MQTDIHNGTSHADRYTFFSYLAESFLKLELFHTKAVEKIKTHILCSITFFSPENRTVYDIMWKNIVRRGRSQMAIWRMRISCWVTKPADTHSTCNTDSCFTATRVTRTRLSITLYIHCWYCVSDMLGQHIQRTIKHVSQRLYRASLSSDCCRLLRHCVQSSYTAQLHLSALIGTASHPDMQKIRIVVFFFANSLHWQSAVLLSPIYSTYRRLNLSTTPDLKFRSHNSVLCLIR